MIAACSLRELRSNYKYRKITKISPGSYIFQGTFLRGLYSEDAYIRRGLYMEGLYMEGLIQGLIFGILH